MKIQLTKQSICCIIRLQNKLGGETMGKLLAESKDIKTIIDKLTDEEKKQALALLQGMIIGKELAKQQKEPA